MRYGNLAYNEEQKEKQKEKQVRKVKNRAAVNHNRRAKMLRVALYTLIVSLSCAVFVNRRVVSHQTDVQIAKLERSLAEAESISYQKSYEIERSVDMKKIEELAASRLSMQRPEKYQVIYLNVGKDDSIEVTAKEVEGAGKKLRDAADALRDNFLGIFSIN